jgi:hypothetical protein
MNGGSDHKTRSLSISLNGGSEHSRFTDGITIVLEELDEETLASGAEGYVASSFG